MLSSARTTCSCAASHVHRCRGLCDGCRLADCRSLNSANSTPSTAASVRIHIIQMCNGRILTRTLQSLVTLYAGLGVVRKLCPKFESSAIFFFLELHACTGMRTKRMTDVGLQTDMDQCLGRWNIGRTSTEVYDSHPISPASLGLSISLRQRDDSRISSISCERINLLNFALDKFIFIASTSTICGDACPLSCASADRGLQVGPMHETAEMGKLINAALLSLLMRRV